MFGWFRRRHALRALMIGLPLMVVAPLAFGSFRAWHGCGAHPSSPEQALQFARPMLEGALDGIEATPEQRQSLDVILDETVRQLFDVHGRADDVRTRFREAMSRGAPAEELEALRQEGLGLADEASRIGVDRLVEVRAILTPEQWSRLQVAHDIRWGHPRPW